MADVERLEDGVGRGRVEGREDVGEVIAGMGENYVASRVLKGNNEKNTTETKNNITGGGGGRRRGGGGGAGGE